VSTVAAHVRKTKNSALIRSDADREQKQHAKKLPSKLLKAGPALPKLWKRSGLRCRAGCRRRPLRTIASSELKIDIAPKRNVLGFGIPAKGESRNENGEQPMRGAARKIRRTLKDFLAE